MKFTTILRTSSATWILPLAIGVTLFYYHVSFSYDYPASRGIIPYSPEVVSFALNPAASLAYATASSMSAWEAGRLQRDRVWEAAPVRSRVAIASRLLLPVVCVSWLMLLLPVTMGSVQEGVALTPASFPLLAMTLTVSLAHAVIGFGIGNVVPRLIATPALALGVFYLVAASASSGEQMWPRHLSGEFHGVLPFGTQLTWNALYPHVLCAGGVAAGIFVCLFTPRKSAFTRRATPVIGTCTALIAVSISIFSVKDWNHTPPLSVGHARMNCAGENPRVCVPEAGGVNPVMTRKEILVPLVDLQDKNAQPSVPRKVTDSVVEGNEAKASTKSHWRIPLTASSRSNNVRWVAFQEAVRLPCPASQDQIYGRSATLWAAQTADLEKKYLSRQRSELAQYENGSEALTAIRARVERVRHHSPSEQATWYQAERRRACADESS